MRRLTCKHRRNESDLLTIYPHFIPRTLSSLSPVNTTSITPGGRCQPTPRTTKEQTCPPY
ncbi:hypothetical protein Poly21_57110 [Allorhodopirellula heiligendammensis]|uniref:Uncharacterized protein n=1 Tax=Allorhodopirellula heiligendammensis TaxID=2714739 RepID=A0A5C6B1U1_9BACT|nr:hypothetical protein Poly21_57110 [Allorhodopirellula heiligendammensis]